jgi:hypothetical protein
MLKVKFSAKFNMHELSGPKLFYGFSTDKGKGGD